MLPVPPAAEQLAQRLTRYASVFEQPCAEACIAKNFAAQIRAGKDEIRLAQRYATNSKSVAAERHSKAIKNLSTCIREARDLGYAVDAGNGLAVALKMENIAIAERARTPEYRLPSPDGPSFRL